MSGSGHHHYGDPTLRQHWHGSDQYQHRLAGQPLLSLSNSTTTSASGARASNRQNVTSESSLTGFSGSKTSSTTGFPTGVSSPASTLQSAYGLSPTDTDKLARVHHQHGRRRVVGGTNVNMGPAAVALSHEVPTVSIGAVPAPPPSSTAPSAGSGTSSSSSRSRIVIKSTSESIKHYFT